MIVVVVVVVAVIASKRALNPQEGTRKTTQEERVLKSLRREHAFLKRLLYYAVQF